MAQPELSIFGSTLYSALEPLSYGDPDPPAPLDYPLAKYCDATAVPFDDVYAWVGVPDYPWEYLLDLENTPDEFLDWLGYFKGVVPLEGATADYKRQRIDEAAALDRGTPQSLIDAARSQLTNTQHVLLEERTPDPWSIRITVYSTQVVNQAALLDALLKTKPAGIVLVLNVQPSETWDEVNPATTWDGVNPATTWDTATNL